jgi:hypothetical protein
MLSQAVLVLMLTSFVIVTLIFSLYSVPDVFARIKYGNIICYGGVGPAGATVGEVGCCQTQTDTKNGLEIKYCTICADTQPPSHCGPRYEASQGSQGPLSPVGNTTIAPSTGKLPPGSIIKASPGTLNTLTPTGNNTNSSIARAGVYSPTGGCSTTSRTTCIPCDPGIPGSACVPSGKWPTPPSGLTTAGRLGNLTNALTTGNNTSTSHPPLTPLAKQPSGPHHHKVTSTSPTGSNSTGH